MRRTSGERIALATMRSTTALTIVLALFLVACGTDQPTGIIRDPAPEVGHLSLPDLSGTEAHLTGPDDGFLLVYFGYTSCPDICPTTMADVRSAFGELGADADRFTVAMITIDPERDTADNLDHYVKVFFPTGMGLRTDDSSALREVADTFGADYGVETKEDGEVVVSHTAFLYAVDDEGRIRLQWPYGTTPADMAHDFRLLLEST